jgi:hypothetical protein
VARLVDGLWEWEARLLIFEALMVFNIKLISYALGDGNQTADFFMVMNFFAGTTFPAF